MRLTDLLGSFVQNNGGFDVDVKHRIVCWWIKLRESSGVLCDKRISLWLKDKFYKSVVRLTMVCGSECWVVGKKIEIRILDWWVEGREKIG